MIAIIFAALLSISNYPLNPTAHDTVSAMNLHVTTGISSQSGMISAGPELSVKYEFLFNHPFIIRTSLDFTYGTIDAINYPNGSVRRQFLSSEVVYYRGTKRLTAYVGFGGVFSKGSFHLTENNFFNDRILGRPTEINISDAYGYRFLLGLRFKHKYSIEIVVTEVSPSFIYFNKTGADSFTEEEIKFRANYVKVSFGYLFRLK